MNQLHFHHNGTENASSGKTLLVISEIGIGDGLTLLPALEAVRASRPGIRTRMLSAGLWPIRNNIAPFAELIDPAPLTGLSEQERMEWLVRQNFRWVWNTENERSPWRPVIAAAGRKEWISSPPHRAWPRRSVLRLRRDQLRMLFPELSPETFPQIELAAEQRESSRRFHAGFPGRQLVAIHPGTNDRTKSWPWDKFAELALRLAGRKDTAALIFTGSGEADFPVPDHPRVRRVALPLDETLPLLAACDAFVGNDSGFYHLAHALGLPAVALFRSPRNRQIWAYDSDRSRPLWFYLPSPIRRHWHRFIPASRVERAVRALLSRQPT